MVNRILEFPYSLLVEYYLAQMDPPSSVEGRFSVDVEEKIEELKRLNYQRKK
ncbi:hypothetical protein [Methanothermobacter sp. THM-1]|uniref:hypothetical protein n=1 Tax=Methanothermobacter sp. THM-1 TaxID=2606911 RepID=UPI00174C0C66|nr:hypothetical protein [Methanothermobacter sp. THM-1]